MLGKPYGIKAIPKECHEGTFNFDSFLQGYESNHFFSLTHVATSACQSSSGLCQDNQICLPNGLGGRNCVCYDGYESTMEGCVPI